MPRQPQIFWKASHNCFYANIQGKQTRLDPDEDRAQEIFYQLMADRGIAADPLVTEVLRDFIDRRHAKSCANTRRFHRQAIDSFSSWLKENAKRLTVSQVKTYHVNQWLDDRHSFKLKPKKGGGFEPSNKPTSDGYRHNLIRTIKEAMQWYADQNELERVPLKSMKKPPQGAREHVLTQEQFDKILDATPEGVLRDVVVCLWETGCRPQELRAVEARHFQNDDYPCWFFPPAEAKAGKKTKKPRIVPLRTNAAEITKRLVEQYPEGKLFLNSHGKPWSKDALARRFERLQKMFGFPVTPYVFRHSFATRMVDSGKIDSLSLAAAMGHSDSRMLDKHYAKIRNAKHIGTAMKRVWGDDAA